MDNGHTRLLIDDDSANARAFREALLDANRPSNETCRIYPLGIRRPSNGKKGFTGLRILKTESGSRFHSEKH
jgi:hypothetical protein